MKYIRQQSFMNDLEKLSKEDKETIKRNFPDVQKAIEGDTDLRYKFRIKKMQRWDGIWEGHLEINLVFTLHFEYDEKEKLCVFRRIGTHEIYRNP